MCVYIWFGLLVVVVANLSLFIKIHPAENSQRDVPNCDGCPFIVADIFGTFLRMRLTINLPGASDARHTHPRFCLS